MNLQKYRIEGEQKEVKENMSSKRSLEKQRRRIQISKQG